MDDADRITRRYKRRALAHRMRRLYVELEASLGDGRELFERALQRAQAMQQSGTNRPPRALGVRQ